MPFKTISITLCDLRISLSKNLLKILQTEFENLLMKLNKELQENNKNELKNLKLILTEIQQKL
ncbi:hypothetical protein CBLAS_1299 [Campylobacter blaseri]|nr:hypothetical protein CBLAS_1299 [Campylobacter blaseri]